MRILGLDIGSNSVGSAWVDTDQQEITLGVSVFPAGVEETETERGAPKNQKRRSKRGQRRSIHRRAQRKRRLRKLLTEVGLLPSDPNELQRLVAYSVWPLPDELPDKFMRTPWHLRREGIQRELTPFEFGRILVHLNQRRGAFGIETDPEETDEGKVKDAIDRTRQQMVERGASTYGQMMADLLDERIAKHVPIRNRRDSFEFHADRTLIRNEFHEIWHKQKSFTGQLANLLTDGLLKQLDDPHEDGTWRHSGEMFGQRRTYWDTGTLGRCDLEPSDHKCPLADMIAQDYRVFESVNNIRIKARDERDWRPLTPDERTAVIAYLRGGWFTPPVVGKAKREPKLKRAVKNPTPAHIREVLGIDKKALAKQNIPEDYYQLNLENDPDREINTDWFYRCVIHDAIGEEHWLTMSDQQRESINRAILKFDPDKLEHAKKLSQGAIDWWGLPPDAVEKLVEQWKGRPKLEKRVNLSRRAIRNLLPHMNKFDSENNRWPTQIEARKRYADDKNNGATDDQRRRYALGTTSLNKAARHFLKKHNNQLPPAPMVSNPVVRKAIHEVRRHVNEYLRHFKCKPDRIVIEFVRGVKESTKRRNLQLASNRAREKERKDFEADLQEWGVPESNWKMAVLRMRLCKEQNGICPFSIKGPNANRPISSRMAAEGRDVEMEHIIPESITGKTLDFNNIVLCFRDANRNKGKRTPVDWLGTEGMAEVLRRLEDTNVRNNKSKWNRLQAATPDAETYRNSQLTDTAYAARQVADYLSAALFGDMREQGRKIFTTKGEYTARLRADWGLYESEIDRSHGLESPIDDELLRDDPALVQSTRRARKDPTKDRIDHRHHAIDALVVALTGPETLTRIGEAATTDREYYERNLRHPRRTPIEPPWGKAEQFRSQVIQALNGLIVSHKPEKRRIVGALHKETAYGKASEFPGLYTERMSVSKLKNTQLIEPQYDSSSGLWKIPGKGQGRAIRDHGLRHEIMECFARNGIDPNSFTDKDVKALTNPSDWKLCTHSGVPIRTITMLLTMSSPVTIGGKDNVERYYMGGNNHHMEILENEDTGQWKALFWDMFSVATRVRPRKDQTTLPIVIGRELEQLRQERRLTPDLERLYAGHHFVLSLSAGEVIYLKDEDTGAPGFFVVGEVNKARNCVVASPHWDARRAKGKGVDNPRQEIELRLQKLQRLVVDREKIKAVVDPLGRIRWAND